MTLLAVQRIFLSVFKTFTLRELWNDDEGELRKTSTPRGLWNDGEGKLSKMSSVETMEQSFDRLGAQSQESPYSIIGQFDKQVITSCMWYIYVCM